MKKTILTILAVIVCINVYPQTKGVFNIYPGDGRPESSKDWDWNEQTDQTPEGRRVRNVVIPTLEIFRPEQPNGTAVIVAPGGAWHFLMYDKEGVDVARWLNTQGITAFVLKYRVAQTPENQSELNPFLENLWKVLPRQGPEEVDPPIGTPAGEQARLLGEEDGRQAIRYLRERADEFEINPHKIGIIGFSAGGGVAVNVALEHDVKSRPDFVCGIYAGWRKGPNIPADAPPLFLASADDDLLVTPASVALLYDMWHKSGKPVEFHVFNDGGHGFGVMNTGKLSDSWTILFANWLKTL